MTDASTYDYASADPESNVLADHNEYVYVTEAEILSGMRELKMFKDLADAAIAWLDQGQLDRDERLLKAANAIKKMREAR